MSDGDNEEPQFGDGIQELLARGDFAKFPREEGSSRSLTCSRLVDENNLLKPLPKVLIEGTVSASEVLELANVSQDEGMNFETSKVTSPSPSFSKTASGPAVHQPKPRKRREQRISQGGRKGNGGSVRRWLGSVENVAKKVEAHAPLMSNGNKAPLMTNRNTERKAQQPGLRRNLVILNKSESESLVLRILGKDDKLEEKKSLKPGMMLVVEGELAMATPSQMAMKKFSQKCEHEKQATRPRAAGRQASTMQQSRPGDHSGESPAAECARNSNEKGAKRGVRGEGKKMLVKKQINEDESENSFELVEPSVGSMVQQAHQNPGEDLVDEICTTEVLLEGSTQAQHHGDLWEAMPSTEGDGGERIVDRIVDEIKLEDTKKVKGTALKRGHEGQQESVEAVGRGSVKLSKSQEGDAGRVQVGLRGARGDHCALPRPINGSGVWGRHGSWEWEKAQKGIDAVGANEEGGRCVRGKRWRAQRCSTPMCFKPIKPNDLGEVTRLCKDCIDEQVMGFNQFEFQKEGGGVGKVLKSQDQKEKNPAVASDLGGVGEVKPAVVMAPPSIGVKRMNRVRGRRESAKIAMRTFSSVGRSLTSTSARSHVGAAGRVVPKKQKQVTISPALTKRELKRRCKEAGLLQGGSKAALLARLGWRKEEAE